MLLQEMATLRKSKSKLPVNLFIADAGTYLNNGYYKRIKFQKDYGNSPVTRSFATMTLEGAIIEDIMHGCELSAKDIQQIKNFVANNKECLSLVADFKLDYDYFKDELMITGGELATKDQIKAQEKLLQEYLVNAEEDS